MITMKSGMIFQRKFASSLIIASLFKQNFMEKDFKIVRSASVSSAGKLLDRYFVGPYKNLQRPKARSLEKKQSQNSIVFPKLRENQIKVQAGRSRSQASKDSEIESKIKKEIACLRSGSTKKKLQLLPRGSSSAQKQQPRHSSTSCKELPVAVQSWKDLKKVVPSSGYVYVDCQSEPKPAAQQDRTVTVSSKWVLITEPNEQSIYKIDDYTRMLRNYEQLSSIALFSRFAEARAFRKWKMVFEANIIFHKQDQIKEGLKKVYRDVYPDLTSLLEVVRRFRFVASSSTASILLGEYPDYLFEGSLNIIKELHDSIFVRVVETCVRPIKEAILYTQVLEEEKRRFKQDQGHYRQFLVNYLNSEDEILDLRIQERFKKLGLQTSASSCAVDYSYVKSTAFVNQAVDFFKILKKSIFIFNEAYIQWVDGVFREVNSKVRVRMGKWAQEKAKVLSILSSMRKNKTEKYEFYSSQPSLSEIQLITHICEMDSDKEIRVHLKKRDIQVLLEQYTDYLMTNLSFQKVLQSYAYHKHGITYDEFTENAQNHPEIELFLQILKTNDSYQCEEIINTLKMKKAFGNQLDKLLTDNFNEVQNIVYHYNLFILEFQSGYEAAQRTKIPSEIHEYLEIVKNKLAYLPRKITVGLILLDFEQVYNRLQIEIGFLQAAIYQNVPKDFKKLYQQLSDFLNNSYNGILHGLWTIEEVIDSYHIYQAYEEKKLSGQISADMKRLKNYLEVISVKVVQKYQECFSMYSHVRLVREKIDIKCTLFRQKLPKRIRLLENSIDELKDTIWKNLSIEQTQIIEIAKLDAELPEKLEKLILAEKRLAEVKTNMDKLGQIKKIQQNCFIEQDLSINTHSYDKMSHDITLLIKIIKNYMDFKQKMQAVEQANIMTIETSKFLELLNINTKELNDDFLLLIAYEPILKEILHDYEEWKKYFNTIQGVCCLSAEDLCEMQIFKNYISKNHSLKITLADCIDINIYSISHEIYQLKMMKLKKAQLSNAFREIEDLTTERPFKITNVVNNEPKAQRKQSFASNTSLSSKKLLQQKQQKQHSNSLLEPRTSFQFANIKKMTRLLEQNKNHILSLAGSNYLSEDRIDIAVKVQQLEKISTLVSLFEQLSIEYEEIMDYESFGNINYQNSNANSASTLIDHQNSKFLQNYRDFKQSIKESWLNNVALLQNYKVSHLNTKYQEIKNALETLQQKMKKMKDLVEEIIQKVRSDIRLLNFVDTQTVIYIIKNPDYYFQLFYPIKEIKRASSTVTILTHYNQVIESQQKEQFKINSGNQIQSIQQQLRAELRICLNQNVKKYPIDNLAELMNQHLPLQVVYTLDQLYLNENYLSTDKTENLILKNIDSQIKLIWKKNINIEVSAAFFKYQVAMLTLMLQTRFQLRHRIQNGQDQLWFRNILIIENYDKTISLRNFGVRFSCDYQLVDYSRLSFVFPFSDRVLVKICSQFSLKESVIINQSEMVENISARMMALYFKIDLSDVNIAKALTTCTEKYPIFIVAMVSKVSQQLLQVYEALNQMQKLNVELNSKTLNSFSSASIFLCLNSAKKVELSQTLKLRFRVLRPVYPCPKALLCVKLLLKNDIIERKLFGYIVFLFNYYIIQVKEQTQHLVSKAELSQHIENIWAILKKCKKNVKDLEETLLSIFKDYFRSMNVNFQRTVLQSLKRRDKVANLQLPTYDLVCQLSTNNFERDTPENSLYNKEVKQYEMLKKKFLLYSEEIANVSKGLVQRMNKLFELTFSFDNRPIALIGPHQSGKSRMLSLYSKFLANQFGQVNVLWRHCNIDFISTSLDGPINNLEICHSELNQQLYPRIIWLNFDGFISDTNSPLIEYIFTVDNEDQDQKIHEEISKMDKNLALGQFESKKINIVNKLKRIHQYYYCFELTDLSRIEPKYISMMAKIHLNEETMDLNSIYLQGIKNFLKGKFSLETELFQILFLQLKQMFQFLNSILEKVLDCKNFYWLVSVSPKNAIEKIITYFVSLFVKDGRETLEQMYNNNTYEKSLFKVMTYSVYATLQNWVETSFHFQLENIIKLRYHVSSKSEDNESFLDKIVIIIDKQILYLPQSQFFSEQLKLQEDMKMSMYSLIQTKETMIMKVKYTNRLLTLGAHITVLGQKEAGKSTLIRLAVKEMKQKRITLDGRDNIEAFKKLNKELSHDYEARSSQSMSKELLVIVQDVSMLESLTKIEEYIDFIMKKDYFVGKQKLCKAPQMSTFIQRRSLSYEATQKLWKSFLVSFQTTTNYYVSIFNAFTNVKLIPFFQTRKVAVDPFFVNGIVQNSIKTMSFCQSQFKKGLQTWTYDFNMSTLKHIINDTLLNFNYDKNTNENDLALYTSIQLCMKIKNRLQSDRELEELQTHIACKISMDGLKSIQNACEMNYVMLHNKINKNKIQNKKTLTRVHFTKEIEKFASAVQDALQVSNCILINKANVRINMSIALVSLEILDKSNKSIPFCQSEQKFLNQLEAAKRQSSITIYYLSIQEVLKNPQIITYISNYLKSREHLQTKSCASLQVCKFVMEYTIQHKEIIQFFLTSQLSKRAYVLYYKTQKVFDSYQVSDNITTPYILSHPAEKSAIEDITKVIIKYLQQMRNFQLPKSIPKSQFCLNQLFSQQNFELFLRDVLETLLMLLKKAENKKRMLEINLSQLSFMFKEYKQLKKSHQNLLKEERKLRQTINTNIQDLKNIRNAYKNAKDENLFAKIEKNNKQIQHLTREIEQITTYEKIWYKIYKNARKAISRSEFAQLKYMFLINVQKSDLEVYELIAFLLGGDTDTTSIKKIISDINVVSKVKEVYIPQLPLQKIDWLTSKLNEANAKEKLNCTRNILQWVGIGCRLGYHCRSKAEKILQLRSRIANIQQENQLMKEKNNVSKFEKLILQTEKMIDNNKANLTLTQIKFQKTSAELNEFETQFNALIHFQQYCIEELTNLTEVMKKIQSYAICQGVEFTMTNMLQGQAKEKMKDISMAKIRKMYGVVPNEEDKLYLRVLEASAEEKASIPELIQPKQYLSLSQKRHIRKINKYLQEKGGAPLGIIDRRSVLLLDTIKPKALTICIDEMSQKRIEYNFDQYSLIIIQSSSWQLSIQESSREYEGFGTFKIVKYHHIRLVIPANVPIIVLFKKWGPQQFLSNYKIINLQVSTKQFEEIATYILSVQDGIKDNRQELFQKKVQSENQLLKIVQYLCQNTQEFNMKNKALIQKLTQKVKQLTKFNSIVTHLTKATSLQKEKQLKDFKVCKTISHAFKLLTQYFPSEEQTSLYFRKIIESSLYYYKLQGQKLKKEALINFFIEFITEGFSSKSQYFLLFYLKFLAVEDGKATKLQADNLIFAPNTQDELERDLIQLNNSTITISKHLQYHSIQLERIYAKILKLDTIDQQQIKEAIEKEKLSKFNQLILKKLLTPKAYEIELMRIVRTLESQISVRFMKFLKRLDINENIFCVCDASYWVSKLSFPDQTRFISFSQLLKKKMFRKQDEHIVGKGFWIVYDNINKKNLKNEVLHCLKRINKKNTKLIVLIKQYPAQQFQEDYRFMPFKKLNSIFQIRQLTQVNRQDNNLMIKITKFNNQLLSYKTLNQRVTNVLFFQKLRSQITKNAQAKKNLSILEMQLCYFDWDPNYLAINKSLSSIIQSLDANVDLLQDYASHNDISGRVNAVLRRPSQLKFKALDALDIQKRLKDMRILIEQPVPEVIKSLKKDIFYKQLQLKRGNLQKIMDRLKFISMVMKGQIDVDSSHIVKLNRIMEQFKFEVFYNILVQYIKWKKLKGDSIMLHLQAIQSQLHLFLLFEKNIFYYEEFRHLKIKNEEHSQSSKMTARRQEDQLTILRAPSCASRSSVKMEVPNEDKLNNFVARNDRRCKTMLNQRRQSRKVSILSKLNQTPLGQISQEQFSSSKSIVTPLFKQSLYYADQKVFSLVPIPPKELKQIDHNFLRTIGFLQHQFTIRVVSYKEREDAKKVKKITDNNKRRPNFFELPSNKQKLKL